MDASERKVGTDSCSCRELLEEVQLIDLRGTPLRAQAREAGAYWEALVAADIAGAIKELLKKNFARFKVCKCQHALRLRVIWLHPVLQAADRIQRVPILEEPFSELRTAIWRLEHFLQEG